MKNRKGSSIQRTERKKRKAGKRKAITKKGFQFDAAQRQKEGEMEGGHENSNCSQLNGKPKGEQRISRDGDTAEKNEKDIRDLQ